MKKFIKIIGGIFFAAIILVFAANNFVRVSTPEKSWGIVENLVFGHPVTDFLTPPWSQNYKRWKASTEAGLAAADLMQKHGLSNLTYSASLTAERQVAQGICQTGSSNATALSRDYLAASNPKLPEIYFDKFVPALDCWQRGFAKQDLVLVHEGVSKYNEFLIWMQAQDRRDFKVMR